MEHKYIFLKDSDGYENLWKIIHETNEVYAISRCETMSVVLKDTCFNKGGSILYSNVIRDFESVSYVESDESYFKYLGIENYQPDYEEYLYDDEWEDYCDNFYAEQWYEAHKNWLNGEDEDL